MGERDDESRTGESLVRVMCCGFLRKLASMIEYLLFNVALGL